MDHLNITLNQGILLRWSETRFCAQKQAFVGFGESEFLLYRDVADIESGVEYDIQWFGNIPGRYQMAAARQDAADCWEDLSRR